MINLKKLIHDGAAEQIKEKHTEEEIENGIITLNKEERPNVLARMLKSKLMEEVKEAVTETRSDKAEEEINDVIRVAKDIKRGLNGDELKHFSEGWFLEDNKTPEEKEYKDAFDEI